MTTTTFLYRHFNKGGKLLYVGIATNVQQRTAQHVKRSPWAKYIFRTTTEKYATRIKAAIAELQVIDAEKPIYNTVPGRERKAKMEDAVMFSIRVPESVLIKIDVVCGKKGLLRSDFVRKAVEKELKRS